MGRSMILSAFRDAVVYQRGAGRYLLTSRIDPSDNVVASYLVLPSGKIAQATMANKAKFPNATEINNGSGM